MYEIKFLSSKDFDSLPLEVTRGSNISDSLGFYNPEIGKAYIRWTAYPDLNKYLLDHEFEHMIEDHATDYDENGIRHKKFKNFVKHFFLPPTILIDNAKNKREEKARQQADAQRQQNEQQAALQSQLSSSMFSSQDQGSSQAPASYGSNNGLPESEFRGLNKGLNQQTQINPFAADQERFRYGAPAGRLVF